MDLNRRKYLKYVLGGGLATAAFMSGVGIKEKETIIGKLPTFIIGNKVTAAGIADFTCDGFNDDVQVQSALDLLPSAVGGKLQLLAGNYIFAAAVSRAINNVTIEGLGRSTYIAWDGASALFDLGATDYWHFKNLRLDAGGIDFGTATKYILENVWIGTRFYEYYEQSRLVDVHTKDLREEMRVGGYFMQGSGASNGALTANRFYASLFVCPRLSTWDRIAISVQALAAGKFARLGIYSASPNTLYPDALILDAGVVSVGANGLQSIVINQQLDDGTYYVVWVSDGSPRLYLRTAIEDRYTTALGLETALLRYSYWGWIINDAYGVLPAAFPGGGSPLNTSYAGALRLGSLD